MPGRKRGLIFVIKSESDHHYSPEVLSVGLQLSMGELKGNSCLELRLLFENQKIPTFLPITFSVFSATRLKLPAIVLCKQCKRCSFSEWIDQSNYHSIILPVSSNNTFPLPVIPPFNHLLCSLSTLKKCLEILLDAVAAFWLSEIDLNQFSRALDEQTSCL